MKRQLRIVTGLIAMLSILVGLTVVAYAAEKHPNQVKSNDIGLDEEGNPVDLDLWEYSFEASPQLLSLEDAEDESDEKIANVRYVGPIIDGRILGNAPATIQSSATNYDSAFQNMTSLIYPPEIPEGVISMNHTFNGCSNLVAAPEIPSTVTSMNFCFANCTSMVTPPPSIPEGVYTVYGTFANCSSMTTAPQFISWPGMVQNLFIQCTSLNLDMTVQPTLSYTTSGMFDNVLSVRFLRTDTTLVDYAASTPAGGYDAPQNWIMVQHEELGNIALGQTYSYTGYLGTKPLDYMTEYVKEEWIDFTPTQSGEYRILLNGSDMTAYFGEKAGTLSCLSYHSSVLDITRALTAGITYRVKIEGSENSSSSLQISSEGTTPPAPPQEYIAGEEYSFAVKAENVTNFSNIVYKLEFDNTKFDIVNLCAGMYPAKTTTGTCSGQYITIQSIDSTGVTFKCTRMVPAGKAYTGVINVIKLKAKTTGEAEVKVTTTNA
ncbi:hypothetical protein [Ligaoa zhengdingensis]|uniref:hypothetical protein n=1 Tax=Ligaoa zhengdingensis TaxID=2763658 RepID=UPI0031BAEF10